MGQVIVTENLSKFYGEVRAVEDLNLSIGRGEIYGFLGLNGAGKTTTIKMLLGLVSTSRGRCYLEGQQVDKGNPGIWNKLGYIVETPYSYPELTVKENLQILARLRGLEDKGRIHWIIEKLKLGEYKNRKAKELSMGNAQRLGIAKALIHRPRILLLDEPTNGLDPAGIVEVRNLLLKLAQEQAVTILISSHKLDEISRLASRIGIIHKGSLIRETDGREIKKDLKSWLLVDGRDKKGMKKTLTQAGYKVEYQDQAGPLKIYDREAIEFPERIATLLVKSKHPPSLLKLEEEDLEGYFLRTIREGRKGQ